MRLWSRAAARETDDVLGKDITIAEDRMARRYAYLVATTGSWPVAWRNARDW